MISVSDRNPCQKLSTNQNSLTPLSLRLFKFVPRFSAFDKIHIFPLSSSEVIQTISSFMARPAKTAVAGKPSKATVAKASGEKVKKVSALKKVRSHPPYYEMIKEAIVTLKERTGSSVYAIAKFVEDKQGNNLPANFKKLLSIQLKKFVASGKLTKVKNSYKLAAPVKAAEKKPKKPIVEKKVAPKRKRTTDAGVTKEKKPKRKATTAASAKKTPVKKTPVKKTPVKKAPVKKVVKPKSIKSPAAKKTKK